MSLRRDTISLLLAAERGAVSDPRAARRQGRGREALHHALELSATDLEPVVLYIDPEPPASSRSRPTSPAAPASR